MDTPLKTVKAIVPRWDGSWLIREWETQSYCRHKAKLESWISTSITPNAQEIEAYMFSDDMKPVLEVLREWDIGFFAPAISILGWLAENQLMKVALTEHSIERLKIWLSD